MKKIFSLILVLCFAFAIFAGCSIDKKHEPMLPESGSKPNNPQNPTDEPTLDLLLTMTVNGKIFSATLLENDTVTAFLKKLPLTLNMSAMAHEKYYNLPFSLPTNAQSVNKIRAGDLMLWGNDCLVVFYEDFNTSYRYTPLGRIEPANELKNALGSGGVVITLE